MLNNVYFRLKPFLPWGVRIALRRLRASYKRANSANVWPIDEQAGAAPPNWPGWPDGKRFALVLTHDVEGAKGLSRIQQLMNMELKHGFHSSFYFVPEGEYNVSDGLRRMLEEAQFEVGVHGLDHDGRLYSSKSAFKAKAAQIREYLQHWNACGFRSPLMQHELGWLHALGVEYDASTFDTDPFEPQPDAAGTIFPFWVPGPDGNGYVELPYTLIQDFNLFKVLRARDTSIWKRKVDWLVEHGGMVLLNTHPDYMCFGGRENRDEYPVSFYEELLSYVKEKYEGSYWNALPREVARYYCKRIPLPLRNTRKKICMVAYTPYESDNRVRRYAEALAKRGDHVDVIAISWKHYKTTENKIKGVAVYPVQHRELDERTKWTYAWRLLRFLWSSSRQLTRLHKRYRYDVIHVHNMPDFLAFAAWYPKLTGAKLILDIHDIVPEFFASKFHTKPDSIYVALMKAIERASAQFVDHVIVSNHLWYQTLVARSVAREKCSVVLNRVDPELFGRATRTRTDDKVIVLFPGSVQWHQGLDIAIEAFVHFKSRIPNAEFHIYTGAGGAAKDNLSRLIQRLDLEGSVKLFGGVPFDKMPQVIANADLGVVPKRADSFGNEAYSTKIMEFLSQGVPAVVSRTKVDIFYFHEGVVHFFPSGDPKAMAQAMLDVIGNPDLRKSLIARGYEYVEQNSWDQKRSEYLELIDSLSTERFEDIPHTLTDISTFHANGSRPLSNDSIAGQTGGLVIELDGPTAVSTVKKD